MSEEALDHNTAMHHLIETGDDADLRMILGHKDRLRCGGVIRTGVKVPKASLSEAEKKRFSELEAQGLSYDDIDRQLGGEPKTNKSKLYPKNADFFVIRECDFSRPSDARELITRYADADGKVRRIPVWFSVGEIERIIPHGFKAFGAGGLLATSFYDGKKLMLRYVDKGAKAPYKKEDWKVCPFDPEKDEKSPAGHTLVFGGLYRFNIPGIKGFDEIMVPTRSWYGMSYSVALLRRVRSVLGRIDGLLNGEAFFWLSKSEEEIAYDGKRQKQFIPVFELMCDPIDLARYAEPAQAMARAQRAMSALSGSRPVPAVSAPAPVAEQPAAATTDDAFFGADDPARIKANEYLHNAAKSLCVSWEQFATYATVAFFAGIAIDDASVDDLRSLAEHVRSRMKDAEDKKGFANEIADTAASVGVVAEAS